LLGSVNRIPERIGCDALFACKARKPCVQVNPQDSAPYATKLKCITLCVTLDRNA